MEKEITNYIKYKCPQCANKEITRKDNYCSICRLELKWVIEGSLKDQKGLYERS